MQMTEGGVTAAKGFVAAGIYAGIKKDKKDMAMIYSKVPCVAAGTFTTNIVKAAPVKWDQDVVYHSEKAQAVVANSGVANACTGEEGMRYCRETARTAAELLNISEKEVLVASTGVIGRQLPIDIIKEGVVSMVPLLSESKEAGILAAESIMTTDTIRKEAAVTFELGGRTVTVGGMSKGSGMIHPNMCTMLSFVTTDAAISKEMLQKAQSASVKDTYNMISVDGDTSTNDTALILANGLAGNDEITEEGEDFDTFLKALNMVNTALAKKMAGDGEGATALFEVKVIGAESKEQAVTLSKSVITSNLTKAAIFGHDANWGRILCAMGYSGAEFDPEKVDLYFESAAGKLKIIENGVSTGYSEELATKILSEKEVTAIADIKMGDACATAWGCDLTFDYVKINADYRS
ncbi:bifunctional ornithine acetyltransferase/N-acetylglutamate synthase [Murimonas intestini]|uniref:Arginine biosynthesis bifunctional protein ArgJ n=1 Tax=Murimonas intestini TaxID=1337051 RepID=A0AB73T7M5_9FIRM|nr:bifunctional ornithine acetyltransferase/N-acetylglutamate synthase [Murimonas intestini]MCR1841161.1 bifunctional ornithine acetyltransferase/N-acetylglutamate synthase [Murimonas intestini]MCR1866079.1 bifunctional ornithine acetyltransferase/N-acetylglutamate synthase [Murimonas intestini]MCR1882804.1 bifunctional ornithine acetyltransferase/N-acetylglutamate synthase [Murimonas intestini]